ncbi:unnamed protein product [Cladocopium goreaui]|uniref:Arylamine N-acetyltransferase n=1 Tax=Cladocopium goreaui TaxID=2562237 RepID=A0A9P1D777_9DINO|nr:unnamed protein product [Cladocopium goreaui]
MTWWFYRSSCVYLGRISAWVLQEALVDAYLGRLQLCRCAPTLESLQSLLAAHVDRVIYENLDLQLRRPLPPLCFEESVKRVAKGRGGYCFLLVDAFAALLCSLGFQVSLHTATCSPVPEPEVKWGDHVVLVVHLPEGPFIADVGLGEGPRWPFKVENASWTEDGFQFAMTSRSGGEWRFDNPVNATGTMTGFAFDFGTSTDGFDEFLRFHDFFWNSKESSYVKGPVFLHRKTTGRGLLSLFACTLRRSHPEVSGGKEILQVATTKEEWFKIVEDVFLMTLDDLDDEEKDRLWDIVQMQHQSFVNVSILDQAVPGGLVEIGAVEPDVAAQQQAEDLMSEMSDKIDASATRQLRGLEPTEALAILTELRHADGIRNPSAFIMSAVKRCNNQGRSSGSRRRDPPRLQQGWDAETEGCRVAPPKACGLIPPESPRRSTTGPHAEEDDGYGGDDYESHSDRRHGNSQDRSRDNRVYGSYDYGSDSDRYGSPSDPRALLDP